MQSSRYKVMVWREICGDWDAERQKEGENKDRKRDSSEGKKDTQGQERWSTDRSRWATENNVHFVFDEFSMCLDTVARLWQFCKTTDVDWQAAQKVFAKPEIIVGLEK